MGEQIDMLDQMYAQENKELLVAKNIERIYKNLSYVRDVISSTSLRYKDKSSPFTVNKKLAYASELIHYAIFHLCTFLYFETRGLKQYRGATPMTLIDDVEAKINAGLLPGRPLDELVDLWISSAASVRAVVNVALRNLQDTRSLDAIARFELTEKEIRASLIEALKIKAKDKIDALQSYRG